MVAIFPARVTAAFRPFSNARPVRLAATPLAPRILITVPIPSCRPAAAGYPGGNTDAHSGFHDFGDRNGLGNCSGAGPDVRSELSGLHTGVRSHPIYQLRLYLIGSVRRVCVGPRGAVPRQSVLCERVSGALGATPQASSTRLLS